MSRALLAVAVLGLLVVPGTALAQFAPVEEEAGPGITINGNGFAHVGAPSRPSERSIERAIDAAQPVAITHAVDDARRRAEAIAEAAGVQLGRVDQVEVSDTFPQFRQSRSHCRRSSRTTRLRCRVPALTAAAATVTFSIVDGAEGAEDARTVEAYGAASVSVEPKNPGSNRSIRQALLAARLAVIPEAAAAARRNVEIAARAARLELGGTVSFSEEREQPYFYDVALGSFGPGQYCRVVRRATRRRDPQTGRRRIVRRVRQRRCFFPRTLRLRLEATYEAR